MTRGRLKRESNPPYDEQPGFTPQHDSTGQGDFVNTSPLYPLPIKDVDVKAELELIKIEQKKILARLDEPIPTQVTGSNVELIKEHLGDDSLLTSNSRGFGYDSNSNTTTTYPLDVSGYRKKAVFVQNNHDVSVTIDLYLYKSTSRGATSRMLRLADRHTLSAGASQLYELDGVFIGLVAFIVKDAEPNLGNLNVTFLGGK